jgi:voltage-dependent calcium channel L type alpha-1D
MEGWVEIMEALDDATGSNINWLFFVILVLFGGYILMSMIIGALTGHYVKEAAIAHHLQQRQQTHSRQTKELTKIKRSESQATEMGVQPTTTAEMINAVSTTIEETKLKRSASFFIKSSSEHKGGYDGLHSLLKSKAFEWVIVLTILANAVFLAMDKYDARYFGPNRCCSRAVVDTCAC